MAKGTQSNRVGKRNTNAKAATGKAYGTVGLKNPAAKTYSGKGKLGNPSNSMTKVSTFGK